MARRAHKLCIVEDAWGDAWDVRELRKTPHGFEVASGWPHGEPRGKGGAGGPKIIVTQALVDYMNGILGKRVVPSLPIGSTSIKRIRRLLGHDTYAARASWWEDRAEDLADLTIERFAQKHGVSVGAISQARTALLGRSARHAGWWRAPDVASILLSERPRAAIADMLDISVGSVGRLRWALKYQDI